MVRNGDFSTVTSPPSAGSDSNNNGDTPPRQISGWNSAGYNFVFLPDTAGGGDSGRKYKALKLWRPGKHAKGTVAKGVLIPSGPGIGNYIGANGRGAIEQSVTGLTVGTTYAVSFAWAGASRYGGRNDRAATGQWLVSLGTSSQSTPTVPVARTGFSGWMTQTFNYVATSSTEVLSFLTTGTPSSQPQLALLANVSMTAVPEPGGLAVMLPGFVCVLALARRRRRTGAMAPRNRPAQG